MKQHGLKRIGMLALMSVMIINSFLFTNPTRVSANQLQAPDLDVQSAAGRTLVRWFVGLGSGSNPDQIAIQQEVVNDFNASQSDILLVVEFVSQDVAEEALAAEIAQGNAPDIVGPVGWGGAAAFHGEWLDLAPLIATSGFNTSIFDPALLNFYNTDEGQVALPFIVFPAAIYYNPALFDNAGLNYPPAQYGGLYTMPDTTQVEWNWDTVQQVSKMLTLDINGRNSMDPAFDSAQIQQYGFSFGWQNSLRYWGSYWQNGSIYQGTAPSYTAQIPDAWKAAANWVYDGMWGDEIYIPNGPASAALSDNVFNSGQVAMLESPYWYLCCVGDLVGGGGTFQFAAMPEYEGQVAGRVDADTFRILKDSAHPNEAFRALSYLVTTGVDKLLVGSDAQPAPFAGSLSAIPAKRQLILNQRKAEFPFVTQASWDVMMAGLSYPDNPSAESWLPNHVASNAHLQSFTDNLFNTPGLDLTSEFTTLESELTTILNEPEPPLTTRTAVRWFVGLGTGTDPGQIPMQREVADDFNQSQTDLLLVMEVVPFDNARTALAAEMEQGNGPDIIGPVGWGGSNAFYGKWLDIEPLITSTSFDTSIFNPALVDMFQTEEGQVGLPFSVFPAAIYYNPALFDAAGLNYPPAHYGELYTMPDNSEVEWSWDTVREVSKRLTLDVNGRNAKSSLFDETRIAQYGFSFGWQNHPKMTGSYWQSGQLVEGTPSLYSAAVPDAWRDAWRWLYDGLWSAQRFIPNGAAGGQNSATFNNGNIAMLENPLWFTCCINDLVSGGGTFQFGAMPSYNGQVAGRVDADTFRIWKNTTHPDEAFQAMTYLVTTGVDKLVVGSETLPSPYGGLPAITDKLQPALDLKKLQFPFVTQTSWDIMVEGLNYPDVPSAEGWMPNFTTSWDHLQAFSNKLFNTRGLKIDNEIAVLEDELTLIFNYGDILNTPQLLSPTVGEQLLNNRPPFDWLDTPKATGYNIQVSKNAAFTTLVINATTTGSAYTPTTDLPANTTLYWRVRAKRGTVYGKWSGTRTFVTANPPSLPVLLSPASNSFAPTSTPTLDWKNSTVPATTTFDHYQIQLDDNSDFSSTLADEDTTQFDLAKSDYPVAPALQTNARYYWRVRAFNTAGHYSSWSATWTFHVRMEAPVLLLPAVGSDELTPRPTFDWEDIPGPGGVTSYVIQISKNGDFTQIVHTGNPVVSTYIPTVDLPKNMVLHWRVQGKGANGPSAWSDVRSLNSANSPSTPGLSAPALNALLIDDTPVLKWGAVTLPATATFQYYQVQVDDDPDFSSTLVNNTTITNRLITQLEVTPALVHNDKYYWRVRAVNTDNEVSNWSVVRYFRIKVDVPLLLAPANGAPAGTLQPIFDWGDVAGPDIVTYTIQVSASPTFATLIVNSNAQTSTYQRQTNFPSGKKLYWRVRANGPNGTSAWSPVFSFTTP